jgi:hypothetical protein
MMINEFKIALVFLLFTGITYAQKHYTPIRGEKGEILITVDSLSFRDNLMSSEFFIDSLSKVPYTGKATRLYSIHGLDSLDINNGYLNGLSISYSVIDSELIISGIKYIDREKHIIISRWIYTKSKKGIASILFYKSDFTT